MEKQENRVDVLIDGKVVTLKSSEPEEYLHRLARYIDKKITDTTTASKTASLEERTKTLLIALNVADDYFKSLGGIKELEKMQSSIMKEMERMQKENTALQQKVQDLQNEVAELLTAKEEAETPNLVRMPEQRSEQRKAAR